MTERVAAAVPSPANSAQVDAPPAVVKPAGTFGALAFRDFRFLWVGTFFMSAGQWVQQVTLGWLLYDLTGSSVLLGAMNGLRALPFLVAGPLAGVAADRTDRRRLLLAIQTVLATATFSMGVLVASPFLQVWHLFAYSAVTATAWAVNQPVRQTLVSNVVPQRFLMNAIALTSLSFNTTKVLGPALGGVLIASFGPAGNFFVQAAAFTCVFISISFMRTEPVAMEHAQGQSVLANLKEGVRYILATPAVLAVMISGLVPNIFLFPYMALMPVMQKDVLHLGPEALGLMLAAPGLGAIGSALLLANISSRVRKKGWLLLLAIVLMGVTLILFAQSRSLPFALMTLVLVGGSQILYATTTNTILQTIVPDQLRGRVMSVYFLDHGLSPLGALFAGVTTQFIGAPSTLVIMGALVIGLAIVVAWRMPVMRQLEA